ncbi:hypothetical protein [Acinetobacter baumannii]|uniref:hypothetical protein n=1 Tax=Acinetobacter baumannii TaxID=470 RepID=UPI003A865752
MSIIYQIVAWVILIVGVFALINKFYSNFKDWITNGNVSYLWLILITIGIFIFLTYPYFFNLWAVYFWHVPESELTDFTKLGPLGDIYGSLNTLFTSATLAIVIYSTILQRQANEDTRKAMYKELVQAKRLSSLQLKQAKQASAEQLKLVKETHNAQIRESQYTFFTNQFYSLLNLKENKFHKLKININGKNYEQEQIFIKLSNDFNEMLMDVENNEISEEYINKKFMEYSDESDGSTSDIVLSYFLIYVNLIKLIKKSELNDKEKEFYFETLGYSMRLQEQIVFFWVSSFVMRFNFYLENTQIFNQFYSDEYLVIAKKFHTKSAFPIIWHEKIDEFK